ncbi:monovalent cation:proton antiporter-2 (CPA2) family protein [Paenibacillus cellulosilyticus]|uniref:Monovalent cation:proton antiporter-2 (CPA2) family protein n=1 Tax=Paenibacillus cellulosilyticus TaxID=375489 RepID=A0A2V2YLY4_9BACL|nr:cation:proton antiporter [Paenibacillus cellulosilyticus]PWV95211.1 monovalent cation:proton antiporter-2 (CPA2) family protein [Paenibacillus cellulosilyticus]QKS46039.1 cation:proton antiporter [Paenibacillus cellulosilyticus]
MSILLTLMLIIAGTKLAGDLAVRLGQPSVLGKLIAGIVLGPAALHWIEPEPFINEMSEIGVLLLMFIAGLETDLDQMKRNWRSSVAVAVGGIVAPFVGGYLASIAFGLSNGQSLFVGMLLCATSVSISVQTLKEMNALQSREGTTILGAAVVDDVIVVILLAVMMSVLGTGEGSSVSEIMIKNGLFFLLIVIVSLFVVPQVMKWFASLRVSEPIMSGALVLVCGYAYFAEEMAVAGIIGAFAAGITISQTRFKHEVEEKVNPIAYSLFVPVFFVSIGLNVRFEGIGSQLVFLLVLTLIAIAAKLIGGAIGARLTGFDRRSALMIGAGMVSRGEVALILAASGLESGLLPQRYFTTAIVLVIVTTLVTPPLLKLLNTGRSNAVKAVDQ